MRRATTTTAGLTVDSAAAATGGHDVAGASGASTGHGAPLAMTQAPFSRWYLRPFGFRWHLDDFPSSSSGSDDVDESLQFETLSSFSFYLDHDRRQERGPARRNPRQIQTGLRSVGLETRRYGQRRDDRNRRTPESTLRRRMCGPDKILGQFALPVTSVRTRLWTTVGANDQVPVGVEVEAVLRSILVYSPVSNADRRVHYTDIFKVEGPSPFVARITWLPPQVQINAKPRVVPEQAINAFFDPTTWKFTYNGQTYSWVPQRSALLWAQRDIFIVGLYPGPREGTGPAVLSVHDEGLPFPVVLTTAVLILSGKTLQ
ncbi:hypothetical protein GGX14DRAFT_671966 [Mycena pura]|uniref:Uncharacterized protein n=1 Tax=Mycena pura TaxID=153505 RepID=A0AAD6V406_9AGAR|nr:hypothetical protein GGX14DRAFT_671966 [Mycena pura]